MTVKTDVLVVGCGPAGAQASKKISEKGFSVSILDYRLNIGDKLCTGIVGSEMSSYYPEVNDFVFSGVNSAHIYSDNDYLLEIEKDSTQALIIDRENFIKDIAFKAEKFGANVFLERFVSKIEVTENKVFVEAKFNGNIEQYESDILILATGFGSKLAKKIGFELSDQSMFGYQTKVKNLSLNKVNVFSGNPLPKGYFGWVVPTEHGRGLCGILGRKKIQDDGVSFTNDMRKKFDFDIAGRTSAWGIPVNSVQKKSKSRALLVGDIAGQVKPTTGGGIYFAMRSADIAAEVVEKALLSNVFSKEVFSEYSKKWDKIFKNELRIGLFARQFYESLDQKDVKEIMEYIKDSNLISKNITFDWHSEIVFLAFKTKIRSYLTRSLQKVFNGLSFNQT